MRSILRRVSMAAICLGFSVAVAEAQTFSLEDLAPERYPLRRSAPAWLVPVGDQVVFPAEAAAHGQELWATNGTLAGTRLIQDTYPGSFSGGALPLRASEARVFFTAEDGGGDVQLWVSDGTAGGTRVLTQFFYWPSLERSTHDLAEDRLYFAAFPGVWSSDGTIDGTKWLPGFDVSHNSQLYPRALVAVGRRAFFAADDGTSGTQLWLADGVLGNVRQVTAFPPATNVEISDLGSVHGRLYFIACTPDLGCEPWISDGSASGTRLLADLKPGAAGSVFPQGPSGDHFWLPTEGGAVFAGGPSGNLVLYFTDGTTAGTREISPAGAVASPTYALGDRVVGRGEGQQLHQLFATPLNGGGRQPLLGCQGAQCPQVGWLLEATDSFALFSRQESDTQGSPNQANPWVTDGTAAGTRRLLDLCTGECISSVTSSWRVGAHVYFHATVSNVSTSLWRTDGTVEGTVRLFTEPDAPDSHGAPGALVGLRSGGLVMSWSGGSAAEESKLYYLGDQPGEEVALLPPVEEGASSNPFLAQPIGARTAFLATFDDPSMGSVDGVAVSAGSPETTHRVVPPAGFRRNRHLQAFQDGWIVAAREEHGSSGGLWWTDGTAAGTRVIKRIAGAQFTCGLFVLGQRALLFSSEGVDVDLWASDGTAAGTVLLKAGAGPADCIYWRGTAYGGQFYFIGTGGDLWRTDGTAGGTRVFREFAEANGVSAGQMAVAGGLLYFDASSNSRKNLWRTDGTTAGTIALAEITLHDFYTGFWYLTSVGDTLYYRAVKENVTGFELWTSNGTRSGTRRLLPTGPADPFYEPWQLTALGNRLAFVARSVEHGEEVWITDGSAAGTRVVADIRPGPGSSAPRGLTTLDDRLYLAANDGPSGSELWTSNGTALGTRRLSQIAPGALSAQPFVLGKIGTSVLLSADDGSAGREVWFMQPSSIPSRCTTAGPDLCLLGGRFRVRVRWLNQRNGQAGVGTSLPFSDRSGFFWFFNQANVELVVKVLDGSSINGFYWTFYGGLSDVEYTVEVTDLETGTEKSYRNPPGEICGVGDTGSIVAGGQAVKPFSFLDPPLPAVAASASEGQAGQGAPIAAKAGTCQPDARTLCLLGGRFAVEVDWRNGRTGATGVGGAIPGSEKSGYFWFFNDTNVELVVKMLDGRPVNGRYWVFYGALSNVEYTLRVTDTETGATRTYMNPQGEICGRADTEAFP